MWEGSGRGQGIFVLYSVWFYFLFLYQALYYFYNIFHFNCLKGHLLKFQTPRSFHCFLAVYQTLWLRDWLTAKEKPVNWRCWKMTFFHCNIAFLRITLNQKISSECLRSPLWSERKFVVLLMHWNSKLINLSLQSGSTTLTSFKWELHVLKIIHYTTNSRSIWSTKVSVSWTESTDVFPPLWVGSPLYDLFVAHVWCRVSIPLTHLRVATVCVK